MQILNVTCNKCAISAWCPSKGSSPIVHLGKRYECQVLNGYGRTSVERNKLSESNRILFDSGRTAVTIIQMPVVEGDWVMTETKVVLSPPIRSERESTTVFYDRMFPKVRRKP